MAKGRPNASLARPLSQGLARFQSMFSKVMAAATGTATSTAAPARTIFWRRDRGFRRDIRRGMGKFFLDKY